MSSPSNITQTFFITLVRKRTGWREMRAVHIGTRQHTPRPGEVLVRVKLSVPESAFKPRPPLDVADLVFNESDVACGPADAVIEPVETP